MSWSSFLASLETEGGKLVVLLLMLMFIISIYTWFVATGHTPQEAGRQAIIAVISSLMGILYGYLKAGGPKT